MASTNKLSVSGFLRPDFCWICQTDGIFTVRSDACTTPTNCLY